MRGLRLIPFGAALGLLPQSIAQGETKIHEEGRCAIRGHCGKQSFFGGELPCPDNGLAEQPEATVREKLVNLCGDKWKDGPVCCKEEQASHSHQTDDSGKHITNKLSFLDRCPL
jgi:Niemann-Pick C1 protein